MANVKHSFRKAASIFMSALLSVSVFSGVGVLNTNAVSYSEMSALDQYAYSGDDLGAVYTPSSTTFKVWAPTASKVQIKRYKTGSDSESGAAVIETKDMTKQSQGIWSVTIAGDLKNTYYTYLVTVNGTTKETVDIYARSTGVNGMRGMVVDLDGTDPAGWTNDKRVNCDNQTDAIIWEAHVRDFSSSADSGMKNKGKYLAFTETGTTVNGDGVHPTGIDYLEDLGVTHVHLLPVYDYGSVDETKLSTDQFNWGYDPMNYNTPEGSYSTNPYDGSVRVKEFKQMVQSLHKKNIGVVMDVVYNHTFAGSDGKNDWFDFTVPGYYYRQNAKGGFSNASGCGNETASDRAMYQKYMVDSVVYWATEYHLDGFRFDLMGVHDTDTMNAIRAALDKIDPDILIYGEPWTADTTTCPKTTATQPNMKYVSEEIAAFNDKVRDAIKGSCFNAADPGFIQGAGFEEALKGGIQANSTAMSGYNQWSKQPSQTVTYTSAHDNYTLYDKLVKSVKGGSGYGNRYDDLVAMNKLAGGIILTSQGISFFQAGEEFARSKYGDENSYKSSTSVNQLKWQNTITYADLYSYYKGLIEIRKAYSPFRDPTNTSNGTIYFSWGTACPANVVAFTMYNKINPTNEWNFVAVIHNANAYQQTVTLRTYDGVTLPSQWVIIADGTKAGTVSLGTTGSTVTVPPRSTMVLVDKTSFDNTELDKKCTVTVNHVVNGQNYKSETLKGNEGAAYSTSPLAELVSQGYEYQSSGAASGTFSKAGATVTYTYTIDESKYGTVILKYQDADTGAALAPDETVKGLLGTHYACSPKDIKGYECTVAPGFASGIFESTPATYTFKYTAVESDTLKVHYYNASNWSKVCMYVYQGSGSSATLLSGAWPGTAMTSEGNNWYVGEVDTTDSALFIANNNNNGSQDPSGVGSTGYAVQGEVWVKSGKVYPTGKVIVNYMDTTGNVFDKTVITGMADGSNKYSTSAKTFENRVLKETPSNASGVFTEGTITVNYVYNSTGLIEKLANTSTLSAKSVTVGDSLTVNASATGGQKPYSYEISYKTSTSDWTTLQSYSSNSSYTIKQLTDINDYLVSVKVKDQSGQVTEKQLGFTVTGAYDDLKNTSTLSATSVSLGSSITAKGSATGGTAPYQYQVVYKQTAQTKWTTAQAYKANATVTFKPANATTYDVCVKVKDSTGTEIKKFFTVTVKANALTNNSALSATSISLGSSITAKGSAAGGTAPYQYQVVYKQTAQTKWTTAQSYHANTTVTFKPAKATTYDVCVKVKDSTGTENKKFFTVTVKADSLTNDSTLSATSVTLGQTITAKGIGSGGTAPYRYQVVYKQTAQTKWTTAQSYQTNATVTFKPANATTYDVCVKVKDSTGQEVKKFFTVTVTSSALTNNSKISASSVTLGSSVTMTGAASGGTAPYKYAFYYKTVSSSSWNTRQDFSTNAVNTVKITSRETYDICVKVKDNSGTVAKKYFQVTVK